MARPRDRLSAFPQLVRAKLQTPQLRKDRVRRPRLTSLLAERSAPLVVVAGSAGSGKTTAVVDWLEESSRAAAWYNLDSHDNDPYVFFAYVAAALEPFSGPGRLSGLVTSPTGTPHDARLLASALAEDLAAAPVGLVIVLEDLHEVTEPLIQSTLQELIPVIPDEVTLAITTRADPQLPLARLRAAERLVELRSVDLAFTASESKQLLELVSGIELDDDAVDRLNERIEGWAVGLQLAALSMAGQTEVDEFISTFAGDDRYVADYLIEEVLNGETPEVQAFLLDTSILEAMNPDLSGAISGNPDAGNILSDLYHRNLFVTALDHKRSWYRYHHLFSDLLRARLDRLSPGRHAELGRRASKWCETNGDIDGAIRYAASGGQLDRVADIVEKHAVSLLPQGEIGRFIAWQRLIPNDLIEVNPELKLGRAWANLFTLRTAEALRDLEGVEQADPGAFPFEIIGQVEIMRAMGAWNQGDHSACIRHARRGLELLPPINRMLPSLGHLYLGKAELAFGKLEEARRNLIAATDLARQGGNHFAGMSGYLSLAAAEIQRGDLSSGADHFRSALDLAGLASESGRDFPVRGAAHVGLGLVAFERCELPDAVTSFRRGLHDLRRTAFLDYTVLGYRRWSEAESMQGHHDAAADILAEARAHLAEFGTGGSALARALGDCEVRNLLRRGELDAAGRAYTELSLRQLQRPGEFAHPAFDHTATGIRLDLANGRTVDALANLEVLWSVAGPNLGLRVKAGALHAAVLMALNDRAEADRMLAETLAWALPGMWVRAFVDAGPIIADLLAGAQLIDSAPDLVRRVIESLPKSKESGFVAQPLIDPLTTREIEVLDEIAAGYTNAEIAERLFISAGTVKRHAANIFLKLGAGHRTEAVAKARSLGLFD